MHDLMVAKQIYELIVRYAHRNKFTQVKKVDIEVGQVKHEDHFDDIEPKNLKKNIKMMAEDPETKGMEIEVKKVKGRGYRLVSIEGDK